MFLYGMFIGVAVAMLMVRVTNEIFADVPEVHFDEDDPKLEDEEINDYMS